MQTQQVVHGPPQGRSEQERDGVAVKARSRLAERARSRRASVSLQQMQRDAMRLYEEACAAWGDPWWAES